MSAVTLAVIGGSGVYQPSMISEVREISVDTPYGTINPLVGRVGERQVAFLARHGKDHSVLPHQLNYRANIWGLKTLGVQRIIATTAVGSLNEQSGPGSLVLLDQFLDFTKQRPLTFFEQGDITRAHIDVTEPYCPQLRQSLQLAATQCQTLVKDGGCYVATEGPRYETAAEIKMYRMLGGDVIGMTGVPEVVLARELGICYAGISMVTNWAAGLNRSPLTHADVVEIMNENQTRIVDLIEKCLLIVPDSLECHCCPQKED